MNANSDIFLSVFYKSLDNFTVHFQFFLFNLDEDSSTKEKAVQSPQNIFFESFFPHTLYPYKTTRKIIIELSEFNLESSLDFLLDSFLNLITKKELGIFALLTQSMQLSASDQNLAQELCCHFGIMLSTELLTSIIQKFGAADKEQQIAEIAYKIIDPNSPVAVNKEIVRDWSMILAIVSSKDFTAASQPFIEMVDKCDNDLLFTLISRLRLDARLELGVNFLYNIVSTLKKIQRRRALTNTILYSVSSLISSCSINCEPLQKLFDLIYFEKDAKLKDGVYTLMASLLPHLPNSESKSNAFYKKRVYAHADDPKKTERSLYLFWKKVKGGYSSLSEDDDLCFIGTTGEDAQEMPKTFMNVFFKKSDFSICPKTFENVLLHLISIDFKYFIQEMLPNFLMLPVTDPRFITMLSCIPKINSEVFMKRAVSNIDQSGIDSVNAMVRGKVCQLSSVLKLSNEQAVILKIGDSLWRRIDQCDQKINHFLNENNVTNYEIVTIRFNKPDMAELYNIDTMLLASFPYILQDSDYLQEGFMRKIILLCCHKSRAILFQSFKIINTITEKEELATALVREILKLYKETLSNEAFFTCTSILQYVLSKRTPKLEKEELYDIEASALIGLVSLQPITRTNAMLILVHINNLLDDHGIVSYINMCIPLIEKIVSQTITKKSSSDTTIFYQWAISSHYYDIWLLFLSEIMHIILSANYTPLLERIRTQLEPFVDNISLSKPETTGLLLLHFTAHVDYSLFALETHVYRIPLFDPHIHTDNKCSDVSKILLNLLNSNDIWKEQICFKVIQYLDISLLGEINKVFVQCNFEQLQYATTALLSILSSAQNNIDLSRHLLDAIKPFFGILHSEISNNGINSPRSITWTQELETVVIKSRQLAENYCDLIRSMILKKEVISEWPVSSRELALNYLINWIRTKSSSLEPLRQKAKAAAVSLAKRGQMITTPPISYESFLSIFADIELTGKRVLSYLLEYQTDILLDSYCDAFFTTTRSISTLFFDALFQIFKQERQYFSSQVGKLLLVAFVSKVFQNERAREFYDLYKKHVYGGENGLSELIFKQCFEIIHMKNKNSPIREIIYVMKKFVPEIRLLPNQNVCVADAPSRFHAFTPYQFLVALMGATEEVDDDAMPSIAIIWFELLKAQDHANIVPEFIMEWKNPIVKQKLLTCLIHQKAPHIFGRILSRCSLAYFIYYSSQGKNIDEESWPIEVLTKVFDERFSLVSDIAPLIHSSFLYYSVNKCTLLNVLCKQFDVKAPESTSNEDIIVTVRGFVDTCKEDTKYDYLEEWGTEALKWVFRSNKLSIATLSLKIYNEILTPVNDTVISGIIKTAIYYIEEYSSETITISDFIVESFKFFSSIFPHHEQLTFDYATSFLDCQDFLGCCRNAPIDIFMQCISYPSFTQEMFKNIESSIIRPLLSSIEQDEKSRKVLSIVTKQWKNSDLTLVLAPLQELFGRFVSKTKSYQELVDEASQTTLIKTIEYYSLMIDSASEQLADKIFTIVDLSLPKAADENVYQALARLYNSALSMMSTLKSARKLILKIAKFVPLAVTKSSYAFVNWSRSVEEVVRSLKRLVKYDESVITLTDCATLASVENLIGKPNTPRIIPFSTQREIIESMKYVSPKTIRRRTLSLKRNDSLRQLGQPQAIETNWELKPLKHPTKLLESNPLIRRQESFVVSDEEFDSHI